MTTRVIAGVTCPKLVCQYNSASMVGGGDLPLKGASIVAGVSCCPMILHNNKLVPLEHGGTTEGGNCSYLLPLSHRVLWDYRELLWQL